MKIRFKHFSSFYEIKKILIHIFINNYDGISQWTDI